MLLEPGVIKASTTLIVPGQEHFSIQARRSAAEPREKPELKHLTITSTDALTRKLIEIAKPPLERLETITQRPEETGTVTAETVAELKQVIGAMSMPSIDVDAQAIIRC
ncbi:MAG TPA: hypothetical protein VMV92_07320 [Streptosporangiaceae bacterium]|nr:hypothetical protein [Streptosporangiaceae bacterium]